MGQKLWGFRNYLIVILIFCGAIATNAQELSVDQGVFRTKYYQDGVRISNSNAKDLLRSHRESRELYTKANRCMFVAYFALGFEAGFLTYEFLKPTTYDNDKGSLYVVIGVAVVGTLFAATGISLREKAILKYNENPKTGGFRLESTENGYGLVYKF